MKILVYIVVLLLTSQILIGQIAPSLDATTEISSHRPLSDAAMLLEANFGWIITYEDPLWKFGGDVVDTTPRIKPDARRFPAPRPGRISIGKLLPAAGSRPNRDVLVSRLLQANDEAGNAASFKSISDGEFTHFVPTFVKNSSGSREAFLPLLDTPVHIPIEAGAPSLAIRRILDQVEQARGVQIVTDMGWRFDQLVFGPLKVRVDASEQPARTLLVKIFKQALSPRTWHLLCEPAVPGQQGFCVFNLRRVYVSTTDASGNIVQRPLP